MPCGGVGEDMGELQGGSVGQHHLSEILNIKIPVITISNFNVFIISLHYKIQIFKFYGKSHLVISGGLGLMNIL